MAAKAKTTSKSKAPAEPLVAYKGFNRDLTCNPNGKPFKYEIGKTYDNGGGPVVRCGDGAFHWVEMPLDTFTYYGPATGRYAIVEPSGEIAREENSDTKGASSILSIKVDISIGDLTRRAVAWVAEMARKQGNGQFAAGDRGHASAAGDRGHASAAGDRGHASAAGDRGHASAAGDYGHASAAGSGGHASAAGSGGHASAAGYRGHASAAGYRGHASAAGDYGHASAAGSGGHASVKGKNAIAHSAGINGTATADAEVSAISLAAYDDAGNLVAVRAAMVGQDGIEAGKTYRLSIAGDFIEVETPEAA